MNKSNSKPVELFFHITGNTPETTKREYICRACVKAARNAGESVSQAFHPMGKLIPSCCGRCSRLASNETK